MRHKYLVSYSNLCGIGWNWEREAELMLWACKLQPKGGIRWPQVPFGDIRGQVGWEQEETPNG